MQTELSVFLVGSAASYPLVYWALNKLMSMRRPSWQMLVQRAASPEKNGDFLNLLRRETIVRANAILREALIEAEASLQADHGGVAALRADTRQRLEDARQLIVSVLSGNIQKTYSSAFDDVGAVTRSTLQATKAAVLGHIEAIESQLELEPGAGGTRWRRGPTEPEKEGRGTAARAFNENKLPNRRVIRFGMHPWLFRRTGKASAYPGTGFYSATQPQDAAAPQT